MSIYRRMLARELPITLLQLLAIEPKLLASKQLENFQRRAELQTGDIQVLHRLGLSSIAAEHWGKAIHYLTTAVEVHPSHIPRSEEHTSELQSRFDLVCRLLLEKKKKNTHILSYDQNTNSQ